MTNATLDVPRNDGNPRTLEQMEPLLIRASAGTGKTYQLTGRLLRLLVQGAPVESLLATTFTRKAAGEILNRVLVVLAATATDNSGKKLNELRDQIAMPHLSSEDCVALVHRLMRDIHRLKILTLDSLFSQLARTFGYELGLPTRLAFDRRDRRRVDSGTGDRCDAGQFRNRRSFNAAVDAGQR